MKRITTWEEYQKHREMLENYDDVDGSTSRFDLNRDDDLGNDYDHTLQEIMKVIMSKYEHETLQFLRNIAGRGDQEINDLISKLGKDNKPEVNKKPRHKQDSDEVVPPESDTGYSEV